MSNYKTDKNGFTFRDGEDWNDEKSDQTLAYLTKPKRIFSTADNSRVIVANNELTTENQLKQKIAKEKAANNLNPIGKRVLTGMIEHGETTADKLMVKFDSTTGLFTNPDKTIAYKNAVDARKWNSNFEPYSETVKANNAAIKPVKNIGDYYQNKNKNKPINKTVPQINLQKLDPIKAEDTSEPKVLDEATWEDIKRGFKDRAAAAVKADEEAARKQGGIVWLNWRNPII